MLILRKKARRIDDPRHTPLTRIVALDPRMPLIVRQERPYGPHRVYDLRFNQYVGPSFKDWCDADAHREQLLELHRLTPGAENWTREDEQAIRRICS